MSSLPPATAYPHLPPTDLAALRDRLEAAESRLYQIERNRPAYTNAQPARDGHATVFNGAGTRPVLAELVFHMQGSLTLATSAADHARSPSNIVGIAGTVQYGSGTITFTLNVNGTAVQTFNLSATNLTVGHDGITYTFCLPATTYPLNPYTDLVTLTTTAIGTSSAELVVHVELG